jgi:hypothetical protein
VEQRWILFGQPFKVWKYCTGEKSLHNEPILRNKILTFFFSEIFVFFCFVLSGTTVLWDHRDLYVWDRFVLFILILRHVNVDICSSHVFDVKARLYIKILGTGLNINVLLLLFKFAPYVGLTHVWP